MTSRFRTLARIVSLVEKRKSLQIMPRKAKAAVGTWFAGYKAQQVRTNSLPDFK